jgi:RHS repeat-associated protein
MRRWTRRAGVVAAATLAVQGLAAVPASALVFTTPTIRVSGVPERPTSYNLDGATVANPVAIFLDNTNESLLYRSVTWYLDDPSRTGPPLYVDTAIRWDMLGSPECGEGVPCPQGTARMWDPLPYREGTHTVTVVIETPLGVDPIPPVTAHFTLRHPASEPTRIYPDPVTPGVATGTGDAAKFLYTGEYPTQSGAAAGTIDAARAAVVRGRVEKADGTPVVNAVVTFPGHPELGSTRSRADGWYDMVVNSGTPLTVHLAATGYPAVDRVVDPTPQAWVQADDAVLVPYDSHAVAVNTTAIPAGDFATPQGSTVTDSDGTRTSTLLVPSGTTAQLRMPDGSHSALSTMTVRQTEFTAGATGADAMPAALPATSAYTYAVDLSVDEARSAGAAGVEFSNPIWHYNENFLNFPAGTAVPAGYYDETKHAWVPSANGVVIDIVSETGGRADVDVTGDGVADGPTPLAAIGMTDDERAKLAQLYAPGDSLWRVGITHFSIWDFNWGFWLARNVFGPLLRGLEGLLHGLLPNCFATGSVIGCEAQSLGERVDLPGIGPDLVYDSRRVAGNHSDTALSLLVTPATTLPESLKRVEVNTQVAGRSFTQTLAAVPNARYTFQWDGVDAYGRRLNGGQVGTVRVRYVYEGQYSDTPTFAAPGSGEPLTGDKTRRELYLDRTVTTTLMPAVVADARGDGLGGWLLSNHHSYDPRSRMLALGDGREVQTDALGNTITTIAGNGSQSFTGDGGSATSASLNYPGGAAYDSQGNLYVADSFNDRIRRISTTGTITTVAGTGTFGFAGDGGPATSAQLASPLELAVAPDGSVYFADVDNHRVRRIATDGTITTVAGSGTRGYGGDGGPATSALLAEPTGVAVTPDGQLIVADYANNRVRRIATDGTITTVAGTGAAGFGGDDGLATSAMLRGPSSVAVGADGTIYVADSDNHRVRRIATDGTITTVAGTGVSGNSGDGGASGAAQLMRPVGIAVDADTNLFVADQQAHRIRRIGADGIIMTVAGTGLAGSDGDGGLAVNARVSRPRGVAIAPDGALVVVDAAGQRIRRVGSTAAKVSTGTNLLVPSPDSDGTVFEFDASGRHLRTLDELTGVAITTFGYTAGLLTSVTDRDNNLTTITRPTTSSVVLTSPDGVATTIALNASGWASSITAPGGLANAVGYQDGNGLLTSFGDRNGNPASVYTYDAIGRLATARGRDLRTTTLTRTELDDGIEVDVHVPGGEHVVYRLTRDDDGVVRREVVHPNGIVRKDERSPDGTTTLTLDAAVLTEKSGPDPVWGMFRPRLVSTTVQAPGHAPVAATSTRTVTLASGSPVDVATLVDSSTIGTRTWTTSYSKTTRTITSTSPKGRTSITTLDAKGHVVSEQQGNLTPVTYGYDTRGRITSMTQGTGTTARQGAVTYKPNGFVDTVTNSLTQTTTYTYDAAGRLTQSAGPAGALGMAHDNNGNLTSVNPPGRTAYTIVPSVDDRLGSFTVPNADAANDTYTYGLDANRRYSGLTLPSGTQVAFGYDGTGRLQTIGYGSATTSFTWSGGKLATAVSPDGVTVTPGYTSGLPTSSTWSGAVSGSVAQTFDDEMNTVTETVGGTPAVSFGRDEDGLLTTAGAETITRHAQNGFVTGTTLGQASTSWTYTGFGEPDTFSATYAGASVYDASYPSRDKAGRIVQRVETTNGATHTTTYAYTAANRLDTVTVDGTQVADYDYDAAGNVTRETTASGAVTSTFDAQDRITTRGTTTYAFDADGQRTTATDGGAVTTYTWSVGRLAGVSLPGGPAVTYKYDAFGRRVARLVDGTVVRGYLWSGSQLVAETDASGAVLSRFVYGARAHVPDYLVAAGVTFRLVTDERGSVRLVVNTATGAVAQRLAYDAWGRIASDTSPGFQPFGFAGGLTDPDTGLVHFGTRDYDPNAKQWLSRDTIGFSGGPNQYNYVGGDPVNRIDPTGHNAIGCFADILFLLSMIPGLGAPFALAAAALYAADGQWGRAAMALAGAVLPGLAEELSGATRFGEEAAADAEGLLGDAAESCLNSFTADTPVTMGDGTEEPIADINVGDPVLATDPETSRTEARPVTALIRHSGPHTMVDLTLDDQTTITTTDHHPFWDATTRRFTDAIDLAVGDRVLSTDSETPAIIGKRVYDRNLTAYNLQIDGIHTYYAGTTPTLVHNSCFTPDQDAVIQLAKEGKQLGGLSADEGQALRELADEQGLPYRPGLSEPYETHPGRPYGKIPHIHVGPVSHIPILP